MVLRTVMANPCRRNTFREPRVGRLRNSPIAEQTSLSVRCTLGFLFPNDRSEVLLEHGGNNAARFAPIQRESDLRCQLTLLLGRLCLRPSVEQPYRFMPVRKCHACFFRPRLVSFSSAGRACLDRLGRVVLGDALLEVIR